MTPTPTPQRLTIADLCIYPIKALPGVHVRQGLAKMEGLAHPTLPQLRDRSFMVVDARTGKFLTLRTHAAAFSKISLTLDEASGVIELNAPGEDQPLRLDVSATSATPSSGSQSLEQMHSKVWEWEGYASVVDREWFSRVMGCDVCLVSANLDMHRPVEQEYAPQPTTTRFSDGFPYLIAFQESLVDLFEDTYGDLAGSMMPRFRANVVVKGGTPWQEDRIRRLQCQESGVAFDLTKPCSRCTVPTVDPATGVVDRRVAELLRSRRSGGVLGWTEGPKGFNNAAFFGVNACVDPAGVGRLISVGEDLI